MKSNFLFLLLAAMLFTSVPATSKSSEKDAIPVTALANSATSTTLTQQEADRLVSRVKEIQGMDKNNLTREEKRGLRRELTTIKKRLADPVGFGVYISGTALILIIILLIILL